MPTVTRIERGESFSERAIPSDATLSFLVTNAYDPQEAIAAVKTSPEMGPVGTPHPNDPTQRLTSVQYDVTERIGAGNDRGWIVFVRFSVDSSGANFQPVPDTEPTYVTAEYSTLERVIKAPYYFKRPIAYPSGGSITQGFEWDLGTQEFTVSGLMLRVVVNVISSGYNLGAFIFSQDQTNKIHRLPNGNPSDKAWQYLGAQSSQVAADVWSVTHEWWSDPGNDAPPKPTELQTPDDIVTAPERLPFEDYTNYVVPVQNPSSGGVLYVPTIDVYEPFVEEANGWSNLPGFPIQRLTAP